MDLLVWFGMERCEIRKAIHIKKMQDWARNNEERLPKLWQKKMQDWAIKNGAKLGTKYT